MKDLKTLTFKELEPGLALLTLNRPDSLNAIDGDMIDEFDVVLDMLSNNNDIRVLIITGAGRGFSAGADLKSVLAYKDEEHFSDPERFMELVQERISSIVLKLRRIPQPVIAAINGPAAGGGFAIALASDVRIASPEAYFIASFINIGLSGGEMGSTYFLPRLIGLSRASEILYTGRKVMADEAEKIGLLSQVVPKEELIERAVSLAKSMLQKSVGGLKLTKTAINQNIDAQTLDAAVDLENRNQSIMVFSKAFFNMVKAFSGKD
jgi:enoyl-CoA hydratase